MIEETFIVIAAWNDSILEPGKTVDEGAQEKKKRKRGGN